MIMADLDRANERASAAERESEKLRHQLSSVSASLTEGAGESEMDHAMEILQRSTLEAELAAKEKEVREICFQLQHFIVNIGHRPKMQI